MDDVKLPVAVVSFESDRLWWVVGIGWLVLPPFLLILLPDLGLGSTVTVAAQILVSLLLVGFTLLVWLGELRRGRLSVYGDCIVVEAPFHRRLGLRRPLDAICFRHWEDTGGNVATKVGHIARLESQGKRLDLGTYESFVISDFIDPFYVSDPLWNWGSGTFLKVSGESFLEVLELVLPQDEAAGADVLRRDSAAGLGAATQDARKYRGLAVLVFVVLGLLVMIPLVGGIGQALGWW